MGKIIGLENYKLNKELNNIKKYCNNLTYALEVKEQEEIQAYKDYAKFLKEQDNSYFYNF